MTQTTVNVQVYNVRDEFTYNKGKENEGTMYKQKCQINTSPDVPDVAFWLIVKSENHYLEKGNYKFEVSPKVGKFESLEFELINPVKA